MTNFGANTRAFNTLKVDRARGLITKTSEDQKKLAMELDWYLNLPKECEYLIPRILYYTRDPVSITMEMYGYQALNTLWLQEKSIVGPSPIWDQVFQSLDTCIEDLGAHGQPYWPEELLGAGQYMYIKKTLERLEKLDSKFDMFNNNIIINDREIRGLKYVKENLSKICDKLGVCQIENAVLIHGDLCLSNILYEPENGFIRLIDPRGSFGSLRYGDRLYEFAKLSHSFIGNYDFYINGQFIYERPDENSIVMQAMTNSAHSKLKNKFTKWLEQKTDKTLQVKFIQSLLFLSMIPLHNDRPRAQMAFMCQGLQDFNEVVGILENQGNSL